MLFLKKCFCLLSALCFCFCFIFPSYAKTVSSECDITDINVPFSVSDVKTEIGENLDIKAKSAILLEPYTGEILYEQNSEEKLAPASITKIMSLLLVMESLSSGDISTDTVVYASKYAAGMGGSQIWLEEGEGMSVDHLLKATVIASANDACVALAELIAGSEESFVTLMNNKAKELGMDNTYFVNCTGLDADGHITTAHDVAIMSAELIKYPLIKKYSTVWMDTLRDGESELVNTNKLVRFYKGTTGLKTGTTSLAKYCLSATAQRDGMELVAVVMAAENSNERFSAAKKLLDYGFSNYTFSEIGAELEKNEISLKKGISQKVKIECDEKANILMMKYVKNEIIRQTEWKDNITAPVKKGDVLGYVNIYLENNQVGRLAVTASEDVERLTLGVTLLMILKSLLIL